jgi:hypothetical protein
VKQVAADDGWPSAFQACKGDWSRKQFNENKKGSLKEEGEGLFLVQTIAVWVEGRAYRNL